MKKVDKALLLTISVIILMYIACIIITGSGFPCLIQKFTHLYCPGCGITRMFISLFTLNFYQAFRYNPLIFTYLVLYIIYSLINILRIYFKKPKITIYNEVYIVLLIIAIGFGVLRNMPYFSYLAPTLVK